MALGGLNALGGGVCEKCSMAMPFTPSEVVSYLTANPIHCGNKGCSGILHWQ